MLVLAHSDIRIVYHHLFITSHYSTFQWIGLRENLDRKPFFRWNMNFLSNSLNINWSIKTIKNSMNSILNKLKSISIHFSQILLYNNRSPEDSGCSSSSSPPSVCLVPSGSLASAAQGGSAVLGGLVTYVFRDVYSGENWGNGTIWMGKERGLIWIFTYIYIYVYMVTPPLCVYIYIYSR